MSEEKKITHDELAEMFGFWIPAKVVSFLYHDAPNSMTIAEVREKLKAMVDEQRQNKEKLIRERLPVIIDNYHALTEMPFNLAIADHPYARCSEDIRDLLTMAGAWVE